MGVSIYWRPANTKRTDITPGARSAFYEMLQEAFGGFPITLDSGDIAKVRLMSIGATSPDIKKSLNDLVDALEKHEEIEILSSW